MATTKRKDKVSKSFVTPAGIAQYPWLTKPDTKFNSDGVYSTSLILSESDGERLIAKLAPVYEEVIANEQGKLQDALENAKGKDIVKLKEKLESFQGKTPWDDVYDEEGEKTGQYVFRFKSNATFKTKEGDLKPRKIKFIDTSAPPQEISVKELWGGSKLKIGFTASSNYVPSSNTAFLTLYIDCIQVIELKDSSSANYASDDEDGFTSVEGGYKGTSRDAKDDDREADDNSSEDYEEESSDGDF